MDSILISIKKLMGLAPEYTHFDQDIIMHINSTFAILNQLGVGPEKGFSIQDDQAKWTDFFPETPTLEHVKTYVYLKVQLMFDPPTATAITDAKNRLISELEWRITTTADSLNKASS